jgi:hypothetical protein
MTVAGTEPLPGGPATKAARLGPVATGARRRDDLNLRIGVRAAVIAACVGSARTWKKFWGSGRVHRHFTHRKCLAKHTFERPWMAQKCLSRL